MFCGDKRCGGGLCLSLNCAWPWGKVLDNWEAAYLPPPHPGSLRRKEGKRGDRVEGLGAVHTSGRRLSLRRGTSQGQLLQWAVDIYPLNAEHPSPWQPPSRGSRRHICCTWRFPDSGVDSSCPLRVPGSWFYNHPAPRVGKLRPAVESGPSRALPAGEWSPDSQPRQKGASCWARLPGGVPPHAVLPVVLTQRCLVWGLLGTHTPADVRGNTCTGKGHAGARDTEAGGHLGLGLSCVRGPSGVPQPCILGCVAPGKPLDFPISASSSVKWV